MQNFSLGGITPCPLQVNAWPRVTLETKAVFPDVLRKAQGLVITPLCVIPVI